MTEEKQLTATKNELMTIEPKTYVTQVFSTHTTALAAAITEFGEVSCDITTKEGMALMKSARKAFKEIRIKSEKDRVTFKQPMVDIGKMLDERNKEVAKELAPYETKYDEKIKAEEKRLEDIKIAELEAAAKKEAALNDKFDAIKNKPLDAINLTAEQTQVLIDELSIVAPDEESFDERFVEAELLIDQTIKTLEQMVSGKQAQEKLALEAADKKVADEEAATEAGRIGAIKEKILTIKNYMFESMNCETPLQVLALIESLEEIQVISINFEEFTEEAAAAKISVMKSLERLADQKTDEEAVAAKEQQAAESEAEDETYSLSKDEGQSSSPSTPEAVEDQFSAKLDRNPPSADSIVAAIAKDFDVDEPVARQWLIQTDFRVAA